MQVTWIGQAGLLIRARETNILIDPYLSDSVGVQDPAKGRRVPVEEGLFSLHPDVLVFTHGHLDHYDPETAEKYFAQKEPFLVLAPGSCWQRARKNGGPHNYVLFDCGTQWTEGQVRFTAVPAVHSDDHAIGVLIEAEGKRLYITGDTLYSEKILAELPEGIDAVFLPVNGVGNNMNMADAARFAHACGAKTAVPLHVGMMDDLSPEDFACENRTVLRIYEPVEF